MNLRASAAFLAVLALILAGCSQVRQQTKDEYNDDSNRARILRASGGRTDGGLVLFGTDRSGFRPDEAGSSAGLNVNAYLWRATLDTLSFMPLASADPFGGTIITEWYSPPGATNERFRAQAYVLGRQLRSDGVRVQIFRQTLDRGQWVDSPVSPTTNAEMEDKVLSRARELRSQSAAR